MINARTQTITSAAAETEAAMLASLLVDNGVWDHVSHDLSHTHFQVPAFRLMWSAAKRLIDAQMAVDLVTLKNQLVIDGTIKQIADSHFDAVLAPVHFDTKSAPAYAKQIRENFQRRRLESLGKEIHESEGKGTTAELLTHARATLEEIEGATHGDKMEATKASSMFIEFINHLERVSENPGEPTGLCTGLADYDKLTLGLQPADLSIVAARPSMGKTSLVMQWGTNIAIETKTPVLVFSLEMSKQALFQRMIANLARVDFNRIRSGNLEAADWDAVQSAGVMLKSAPIYIQDTAGITKEQMRYVARKQMRETGVGLIIVDYLQLMGFEGRIENRTQEISKISAGLKALGKEFGVPVIALSQLSRDCEKRIDKRPMLSDLRESGAIEQDADIITAIYRDERYDKNSKAKGIAELIVLKQRNGACDTIYTRFDGRHVRFSDACDYNPEDSYSM